MVFGHVICDEARVRIVRAHCGNGSLSDTWKRAQRSVNIGQFHPLPPHSRTAVQTSEILEASVIVDSASISRPVQSFQRSEARRFEGTRGCPHVVPISSCKKLAPDDDFSSSPRRYGQRILAADFELHAGDRISDRHNAFGQRAAVVMKVLTNQTCLGRPKSDGENAARREVPSEQFEIESGDPIPFEPDHARMVEHLPCRHHASKE